MSALYDCWLRYNTNIDRLDKEMLKANLASVSVENGDDITASAVEEIGRFCKAVGLDEPKLVESGASLRLVSGLAAIGHKDGFVIEKSSHGFMVCGDSSTGLLYGVFSLLQNLASGKSPEECCKMDYPRNPIRMINQWDNGDGDIERGYAGRSIFFKDYKFMDDVSRIKDYARLLSSVGINAISINNVNVHFNETKFITPEYLPAAARYADVFRRYGIKMYMCINFASPIQLGGLEVSDPLDEKVRAWWKEAVKEIYKIIPYFGGFLVKADSEGRPGPFTYGRNHADGANMLAEALAPYGGLVIWRCFVYNCHQDWRDRKTDRARAAYDHFMPLDGKFADNVILQIKNGPMDFQIREAVSPLLGAMPHTNQLLEFEITQEYTGQQKQLCYLVPLWKEVLDFDTYAKGEGSYVKKMCDGSLHNPTHSGLAAVSNIGDDECWTGHPLAQANLYGYGRLCWNADLSSEEIAREWIVLTLGMADGVMDTVLPMLMTSREAYENYSSPLGVGWMVYPHHHYGPNIDGYEYTPWGTYHFADWQGIGVDRTVATGSGYTSQYFEPNASMYENLETCPEELLLFFHHVDYTYMLKTGKTLIQHVYDTHFKGVEMVDEYVKAWDSLEGKVQDDIFKLVKERFAIQQNDCRDWRDIVNTYFYRHTGIPDAHGRKIYP